jgi:glycosyltransferase involved in cell wall biosynthesis
VTGSPTTSVAIPCHGYGRFLREAVESVLGQSEPPAEIAVLDDGSTDDTAEVLARLASEVPGLLVASNARPVGTPRARNQAVRMTTGDLVVVLDADDRLGPGYLAACRTALVEHGWDFAYPTVRLFGQVEELRPAPPFDLAELGRANYVVGSAMFTRELFDRLDGFAPELTDVGYEDWDFWLRAVRSGSVGGPAPGAELEYRRHGPSRNRRAEARWRRAHLRLWWRHRGLVPAPNPVAAGVRSARRRLDRG